MSTISYSYELQGKSYLIEATISKKTYKKKDLENAIKNAAKTFIDSHKNLNAASAIKIRIGNKIDIKEAPGSLSRALSKGEYLYPASNPFIRLLRRVEQSLSSLFCFITLQPQKMPVDINLLTEVIGAFPQHGKVSMKQAISFWEKALEKEGAPSEETEELKKILSKCSERVGKLEKMKLLYEESLFSPLHELSTEITTSIKCLKDGERTLVPSGFWKENPGSPPIFQDCLLEVRKIGTDKFQVSAFSLDEETFNLDSSIITSEEVSLSKITTDIPLILALQVNRFPMPEKKSETTKFMINLALSNWKTLAYSLVKNPITFIPREAERLKKEMKKREETPTSSAQDLLGLLRYKTAILPQDTSLKKPRPSQYKSAVHVTKAFLRHNLKKEAEPQDINYKIFRLQSEVDLLSRATSNTKWLASSEYRNVVYHSASKLLSDIAAVRKPDSKLKNLGKINKDTLEEYVTRLEKIIDDVSSYGTTQVKKSTSESLSTSFEGPVALPTIPMPQKTSSTTISPSHTTSLSAVFPKTPPKTIKETMFYLTETSKLCEDLVKRGEYSTIEEIIPIISKNIHLFKEDGKTPFFSNLPSDQAKTISEALSVLQKTACACRLAQTACGPVEHEDEIFSTSRYEEDIKVNIFQPNFLIALLSFETIHNQLLSLNIPPFFHSTVLEKLCKDPISFIRSPADSKRLQEIHSYTQTINKDLQKKNPLESVSPTLSEIPHDKKLLVERARETFILDHFTISDGLYKNVDLALPFSKKDQIKFREYQQAATDFRRSHFMPQNEAHTHFESFIKTSQGKPLPTLPSITLSEEYSYETPPQDLFYEFILKPVGVAIKAEKPLNEQKFFKKSLFKANQSLAPETFWEDRETLSDFAFGKQYKLIETVRATKTKTSGTFYESDSRFEHISEFNFLKPSQEISSKAPSLSTDEIIAIRTLPPSPKEKGYAQAAITNLLKLATYNPRLLSEPRVKLFIYRTILHPEVFSDPVIISSMKEGISKLLEQLDSLQKKACEVGKFDTAIHLISLLSAISAHLKEHPDMPQSVHTDWPGKLLELKDQIKKSTGSQYLLAQEYLGAITRKYDDLSTIDLKNPVVQKDALNSLQAWIQIHNIKGLSQDIDPGIHQEAKTLILALADRLRACDDHTKEQLFNALLPSLNISSGAQTVWNFSSFPSCKKGPITIQLDTGMVWTEGKATSPLPSDVETSPLFEKLSLPKKMRWDISQISSKDAYFYLYTSSAYPDIRIITSARRESDFCIQRKVGDSWYSYVEPLFYNVGTEEKPPESVSQKNISLPTTLSPIISNSPTLIEVSDSPSKIIIEKSDGNLVVDISKKKTITKVSKKDSTYGSLSQNGLELFSALDTRLSCLKRKEDFSVEYPFVHLQGSKKKQGLVAKQVGDSWEYTDESLKGFLIKGIMQPLMPSEQLKKGLHLVIPPGISFYHLLENAEKKQKVLIPKLELNPVFPGHARGTEKEEMKKYSRFATQIRGPEKMDTTPATVLSFDVIEGKLTSKDPVANTYLALLYLSQQRYEEASLYLEKGRTNLPDKALKEIYTQILDWRDSSSESLLIKQKAYLLQLDWPFDKEIHTQAKNLLLEPLSKAASEKDCIETLKSIFKKLPKEDCIRYLRVLQDMPEEIPLSIAKTHETKKVQTVTPFQTLSLSVKDLSKLIFDKALPPKTQLPEDFTEKLFIDTDETIIKYFPTLCSEDMINTYIDVIKKAKLRARISQGGADLLTLLEKLHHKSIVSVKNNLFIEDGKKLLQERVKNRENAKKSEAIVDAQKKIDELYKPIQETLFSLCEIAGIEEKTPQAVKPATPPAAQPPLEETPPSISKKEILNALYKLTDITIEKWELPPLPPEEKPTQEPTQETPKVSVSIFESLGIEMPSQCTQKTERTVITDRKAAARTFLNEITGISDAKKEEIQTDTETYIAKEGELPSLKESSIVEVRDALTKQQKALAKQQKDLRDQIFQSVNKEKRGFFEKLQQAVTPEEPFVPFERLLGSYTKGKDDLKELLFRNHIIPSNKELTELDDNLSKFLQVSVALNHIKETLSKMPEGKKDFSPSELKDLGGLVEAKRHFLLDGSDHSRVLLMLEYSCEYLLRPGNVALVEDLLKEPNIIRQLPPGSGKTDVVLPLLAILKAKGTNLSTLILPEWLYEQNRKDLDIKLKALFGQDIFCVDIPGSQDLSVVELQDMLSQLQKTILNKGVMLTTKQNLLTLKNSFEHLEKKIAEASEEESEPAKTIFSQYQLTAQIMDLLRERMDVLCDEVDSILDIHREVNRKEGFNERIPEWQRNATTDVFSILIRAKKDTSGLGSLARALLANTHVDMPQSIKQEGLHLWAQKYLDSLHIADRQVLAYLLQNPPQDLPGDYKNSPHFASLVAAKILFSQVLPRATLSKANNVKDGYGRYGNAVIPYAGPNQPDVSSEFCHPLELLSFAVQDYLQKGITENQAEIFYNELLEKNNKAWFERDPSITSRKELPHSKELLERYDIDIETILEKEPDVAISYIYKKINENENHDRRLSYCTTFVLPKIETTKEQVHGNAFDLVNMAHSFSGMTGTPHNLHTYHDAITKNELSKTKGSDGRTIAAVIRPDKKIAIKPVSLKEGKSISDSLIKEASLPEYQGIIDIGAYCKEKAPEELAKELASGLPEGGKTRYIVYVDRQGKIVAYDTVNKKEVPFDEKEMPLETRKTIYQVFIGTDIKQQPKAKFLVTIGNNMFLKDFIQGVMRLRELPQEQVFDIMLSPEIDETIRVLVHNKPQTEAITLQDVLSYCAHNEEEVAQKDALSAEKQNIENILTEALLKARVKIAASISKSEKDGLQAEDFFKKAYPKLKKIIAKTQDFSVERLSPPLEELKTKEEIQKNLTKLKQKTLDRIEELLNDPDIKSIEHLKISLKNAQNSVLEKFKPENSINENLLPKTDYVQPAGESLGQVATATAVQQTTATAMQTSYEKKQQHLGEGFCYYERIFWIDIRMGLESCPTVPLLNENYSLFDTSLKISKNIYKGWKANYYKDLSYAVFNTEKDEMFLLDKSDIQDFFKLNKPPSPFIPCVIGPKTFCTQGAIPPEKSNNFYRHVVQIKLMSGFVDFDSEDERKALEDLIREKGTKTIEDFVEYNKEHYLAPTSYALYTNKKCDLTHILLKVDSSKAKPREHLEKELQKTEKLLLDPAIKQTPPLQEIVKNIKQALSKNLRDGVQIQPGFQAPEGLFDESLLMSPLPVVDPKELYSEDFHISWNAKQKGDSWDVAFDSTTQKMIASVDIFNHNIWLGLKEGFSQEGSPLMFAHIYPKGPDTYCSSQHPDPSYSLKLVRYPEVFCRHLIQAKLMKGIVDFDTKEEQEALKKFISEKDTQAIRNFVEQNKKRYSPESYDRYTKNQCTLSLLLRDIETRKKKEPSPPPSTPSSISNTPPPPVQQTPPSSPQKSQASISVKDSEFIETREKKEPSPPPGATGSASNTTSPSSLQELQDSAFTKAWEVIGRIWTWKGNI